MRSFRHLRSLVVALTGCGVLLPMEGVCSGAFPVERADDDQPQLVCLEGIQFRLPGSWKPRVVAPGGDVDAAWREDPVSGFPLNLNLAACDSHVLVSSISDERMRQQIERSIASVPQTENVRVRDINVVELDGIPSYRLRVSVDKVLEGGRRLEVEQLLYVIGAKKALVLTFTAARGRYEKSEKLFEEVVSSLAVEQGFLAAMPPWLCGLVLGSFAGFGGLFLRRRSDTQERGELGFEEQWGEGREFPAGDVV